MEEIKSNAGQGLGIAGLILGILAIPLGIIPCTFFLGILFGLGGIIMSIVALTQATRWNGPKGLIITALVCSIIGFTFSTAWGVALSNRNFFLRQIIEDIKEDGEWDDMRPPRDRRIIIPEPDLDSIIIEEYDNQDFKALEDTLRSLEEQLRVLEEENQVLEEENQVLEEE
ncbi:MAG: hypothetical protein JXA61_00810 [Bacteroidales bacterium]|nr:hypothetical protein [Bacteroidales bacterium]